MARGIDVGAGVGAKMEMGDGARACLRRCLDGIDGNGWIARPDHYARVDAGADVIDAARPGIECVAFLMRCNAADGETPSFSAVQTRSDCRYGRRRMSRC